MGEYATRKADKHDIKAVVACRHCGNAWRFDIADIIDYVNPTLKERLLEYDNI